jgi:hypothetical protein
MECGDHSSHPVSEEAEAETGTSCTQVWGWACLWVLCSNRALQSRGASAETPTRADNLLIPSQLPVEFLLLLTVPVVDPDKDDRNWKRPLNCLQLVISPLVLVLTLQSGVCEYRPCPPPPPPLLFLLLSQSFIRPGQCSCKSSLSVAQSCCLQVEL